MAAVAAITVISYLAGWAIGVPLLLPFLNAAYPWWVMTRRLSRGEVRGAIAVMLVWALTMGVTATLMAALGWSTRRDGSDLFLRSFYRDEMLTWVRTGVGPESEPAVFVPAHLGHLVVFSGAALATGGALAMPMGAMLVNQMSAYVGALAARSPRPIAAVMLGWHPWAILRVIAYVMIGVVLSGPLLSRIMRFSFSVAAQRNWLVVGAALLVLDILLKWLLAPSWSLLLRGLVQW